MLLDLANILSKTELSRKDKILVLIDHNKSAKQINEIKLLAHSNGLREVEKWNISMIL